MTCKIVGYVNYSTILWRVLASAIKLCNHSPISSWMNSVMPMLHALMGTKQTSFSYQKRCNMARIYNPVEMNSSLTMQQLVKQVKPMEVVIITVLTIIYTSICLTPPTITVVLHVQVKYHVFLTPRMPQQYLGILSSTIDISTAQMLKTTIWVRAHILAVGSIEIRVVR